MTITSRGIYTNQQGSTQPHPTEVFTGVQVGDLAVFMLVCDLAQTANLIEYSNGSAGTGSAGYTLHLDLDNGTRRVRIWSKIVTAGDLTAGEMKQVTLTTWASVASNAMVWMVLGATNGWESNTPSNTNSVSGTQASSPYTVASFSDPAVAAFAIWGFGLNGTSGGNLTAAWDGGSSVAPEWDETTFSNPRQGGYKIYAAADSGIGLALTNVHGTSKIVGVAAWLESNDVLASAKSAAAASTKATLVHVLPASAKSAGAASAKASLYAPQTEISAKAAAAASAKGTLQSSLLTISGKSGAASSAKGTASIQVSVSAKSAAAATMVATAAVDTVLAAKSAAAASAKASITTIHGATAKAAAAGHAKATLYSSVLVAAAKSAGAASAKASLDATRNITVRLGTLGRRWTLGELGRRWTAGPPCD